MFFNTFIASELREDKSIVLSSTNDMLSCRYSPPGKRRDDSKFQQNSLIK